MSKDKNFHLHWLKEPSAHDYPAAQSYLSLLFDDAHVEEKIVLLQSAPMRSFKAKDIFRASSLPILSFDNAHVTADHQKIVAGEELSPILLVRDQEHRRVIIADGYHRLCAVYIMDEDAEVPCKIV